MLLRSYRLTLCLNGRFCRFNPSGGQVQLTLIQMDKTCVHVYIYVVERGTETGEASKLCLPNSEY